MYRKRLALFIISLSLACVPASAYVCPSGSTPITSTVAGGNASNPATWEAGSLGTGNGMCLIIQGPVTLDQDLGTAGGTGVYTIIQLGVGSFSVNSAATRHIYFASKGANPVGSGSSVSPGPDATMYGFFFPSGTLSLAGTQANPVIINSADGSDPWYVAGNTTWLGGFNVTIKWCDCSNMGANLLGFYGVYVDTTGFSGSEVIDIENSRFTSPYGAVYVSGARLGSGKLTFLNNIITGRRGPATIQFPNGGAVSPLVQNNTESAPAAVGWFASLGTLSGTAITYAQNAVAGSTTTAIGNLAVGGWMSGSGVINDNLTWNDPSQAGNSSVGGLSFIFSTPFTGAVSSNYCENCYYAVAVRGSGPSAVITLSNNFGVTNHLSAPSQGMYFMSGGTATLTGNIGITTDISTGLAYCIFGYSIQTVLAATNNTCHSVAGAGSSEWGIVIGEPQDPVSDALVAYNLVSGFDFGILDYGAGNTFADPSAAVGVHNNDVSGAAVPYYRSGSIGFDNGINFHPNALYGDLAVAPQYLDPTRLSLANYDSHVLGGPGTAADIVAQLGYRSGWGGTYQLSANPIADALTWFRTGFTPANAAVCPGGIATGALPCAETVLSISPAVLQTATEGVYYSQTLTVNSGIDCTFTTGVLPPGLGIKFTGTSNAASLAGIPTALGSWSFAIGTICANGTASASATITVNSAIPPPTDVTSQVAITATGLIFSRATNLYNGTVTIKNIGTASIQAPLQLVLSSLVSTATLLDGTGVAPSGPYSGAPYITVAGTSPLAPGASTTLPVQFSDPSHATISYVPKALSGTF